MVMRCGIFSISRLQYLQILLLNTRLSKKIILAIGLELSIEKKINVIRHFHLSQFNPKINKYIMIYQCKSLFIYIIKPKQQYLLQDTMYLQQESCLFGWNNWIWCNQASLVMLAGRNGDRK